MVERGQRTYCVWLQVYRRLDVWSRFLFSDRMGSRHYRLSKRRQTEQKAEHVANNSQNLIHYRSNFVAEFETIFEIWEIPFILTSLPRISSPICARLRAVSPHGAVWFPMYRYEDVEGHLQQYIWNRTKSTKNVFSLSLSLSLYIYIYIYILVCVSVCV